MPARMLEVIGFLLPWLLVGIGVIFVAFSGGPGGAREAYLTRGRTFFKIAIPLVYIGLGVAIPAVVLASRASREGNSTELSQKTAKDQPAWFDKGRTLFKQNCAACHNLDAVNARGVTGPDLDKIGTITPPRVESAIRIGGTGQNRMPALLLTGDNAKAVAQFVSSVAGK